MAQRLGALQSWLSQVLERENVSITPASIDASFRRYYRCSFNGENDGRSLIVMDAPPDKETTAPFIHVSHLLNSVGLNAPEILSANLEQGFLLLTDLGQEDYLSALNDSTVDALYADALYALLVMQTTLTEAARSLPVYDTIFLCQEMELFREWYLARHSGLVLSDEQQADMDTVFKLLAGSAVAQPQVFVHRDYHSRNLMVVSDNNPGILDFQDAMFGPVTYDLVSLLRDCYIAWPRAQVETWALAYLHRVQGAAVINAGVGDVELLQWFDWMGVQRHLKAAGIFARLSLRDNKHGYLDDIPRTLGYVCDVCGSYPELAPLAEIISLTNYQ